MQPLKIGFVIDDSLDKPDGVQQYVLTLGGWLSASGHEVHYITSTTTRRDVSHIHSLSRNLSVRFNGNRLGIPLPASRRRLRQLLAAEQFDVLHVQLPHSPFLAGRIITLAAPTTAVVGTFHILPLDSFTKFANRLLAVALRQSLRRFTTIASVSVAAQTFARQTYGITSSVLPNMIDYGRFKAKRSAHTETEPTRPIQIVYLGRLVPRKGCQTLLQAVEQLRKAQPAISFEVIIGGRGPLEPELRQYVAAHGLASVVQFKGFVTEADKPQFLQAADIAVFPSRGGESFGIVLIEAMAAGAAVLAGNNPGYASVLATLPDQLFAANQPADLAHKLEELLRDPAERERWQTQAIKFAAQFDTSVVGQKWLEVYQEALQKRRP